MATRHLAHEVGHATDTDPADTSSKEACIENKLSDEGRAIMLNIRIQREIKSNGGGDIGLGGNEANHKFYNAAYDQYLKDGVAERARKAIGEMVGTGETSSVKIDGEYLNYRDYYGYVYEKYYGHP